MFRGTELRPARRARPHTRGRRHGRQASWRLHKALTCQIPKDTSQSARDVTGERYYASAPREQPVGVGTKRAAAGRLRTDRGAAAAESTPTPYRFYGGSRDCHGVPVHINAQPRARNRTETVTQHGVPGKASKNLIARARRRLGGRTGRARSRREREALNRRTRRAPQRCSQPCY